MLFRIFVICSLGIPFVISFETTSELYKSHLRSADERPGVYPCAPYSARIPVVIDGKYRKRKENATLILLPNFGETGHALTNISSMIKQPFMKVILPSPNVIPVQSNSGHPIHAWYDIHNDSHIEDKVGVDNATSYIHDIIDKEIASGTASHRILLVGFSQGGVMALHCALTYPHKLGGVAAYTDWLPKNDTFSTPIHPENKGIPILKCNGYGDKLAEYKTNHNFYLFEQIDAAISQKGVDLLKSFVASHVK